MKRISFAVITFAWLASSCCAQTFEPFGIRSMARGLGIGFGPGYHNRPVAPNLQPHYNRVTQRQPWRVVPPPAYPYTPFAPTTLPNESAVVGVDDLSCMQMPAGILDSVLPYGPQGHPVAPQPGMNDDDMPDEVRRTPQGHRDDPYVTDANEIAAKQFDPTHPWRPAESDLGEMPLVESPLAESPHEAPATPDKVQEPERIAARDIAEPALISEPTVNREPVVVPEPAVIPEPVVVPEPAVIPEPIEQPMPAMEGMVKDEPAAEDLLTTPADDQLFPAPDRIATGNKPDYLEVPTPALTEGVESNADLTPIPLDPNSGLPQLSDELENVLPMPRANRAQISPHYPGYQSLQSGTPAGRTPGSPASPDRPPRRRPYGNAQAWW